MGTRSLTVIRDGNDQEIVVLYRQFDGYPEGHGRELCSFLAPFAIVNGISDRGSRSQANGAGCLAAQIVAHFKREVGGFYLYAANTRDCGEDYVYVVRAEPGSLTVEVQEADGTVLFSGNPAEVNNKINSTMTPPVSA